MGGGGVRKAPKKCPVLFEWPLNTCLSNFASMLTHTHIQTQMRTQTHTQTYIHTHTHTQTHTDIHGHTHTHMYMHAPSRAPKPTHILRGYWETQTNRT